MISKYLSIDTATVKEHANVINHPLYGPCMWVEELG